MFQLSLQYLEIVSILKSSDLRFVMSARQYTFGSKLQKLFFSSLKKKKIKQNKTTIAVYK